MQQGNLSFEAELRVHKNLYGIGQTDDVPDHIVRNAIRIHAHKIQEGVFKALSCILPLSDKLSNERAKYFVRFGALRRLDMIFYAWRNLIGIVPVTRRDHLKSTSRAN